MIRWFSLAWGFPWFVLRTFFRYWSWAWARYLGRLPARRGARDHRFTIHVTTTLKDYPVPSPQLIFDDVTLMGELSGEEACQLFGFLSIHERSSNAICCREEMVCRIGKGVHGRFDGDIAIRVGPHAKLVVASSETSSLSGEVAQLRFPGFETRERRFQARLAERARGLLRVAPAFDRRAYATEREMCCGMLRDEDGFCQHRPGHPVYVERNEKEKKP